MQNNLSGLDILLDSYDLALPEGTGIKTYALQLISVLKEMGANPELLVSARTNGHALIGRAMLYDPAERKEKKVRGWHGVVKNRLRFRFREAAHIPASINGSGPLAPESIFPYGLGCSAIFNCYRAAKAIQEKAKTVPTFNTSKKYRVWHATQPLPLRHKEAVQITTVHDLIPILHPHLCDEFRYPFYQRVEEALRNSRAIAAVSENTKADLLSHFPVAEEKIVVTPLYSEMSGDPCTPAMMDMTMKAFNIEPHRYILFVGSIDSRKNVRRLVEAYLSLGSDHTLVLAGKAGWKAEEEMQAFRHLKNKPGQDVRQLAYVPRHMLPALYQGAACLAFPSQAEGFGLPVLEAMISGCPVVCSSTTSLPEVCGNAAEYVDPDHAESIAAGLRKVLDDPVHRASLVEKGYKRAAHFSRARFASKVEELYSRALA